MRTPRSCMSGANSQSPSWLNARERRISACMPWPGASGVLYWCTPRSVPASDAEPTIIGLRRMQAEDQARHACVAVALDEVLVLRDAEDRDGQRRRVAPGLGGELLEIGKELDDVAVLRPARVRHPAVAVGDGPARAVR